MHLYTCSAFPYVHPHHGLLDQCFPLTIPSYRNLKTYPCMACSKGATVKPCSQQYNGTLISLKLFINKI